MQKNRKIRQAAVGVFLPAILLLSACQAPPIAPQSHQPVELPPILSRTVKDGKGIPNGRSDADTPSFRARLARAQDAGYGLTAHNPVKAGPWHRADPIHILFLNSLRGPQGQALAYERLGSCCMADAPAPTRPRLLDIYRIRVDGSDKDTHLFVDNYSDGPPQIPAGFQQRE